MASDEPIKASKIIIPKPGELLMGLGASGALADAAAAAEAAAHAQTKKMNEAIWESLTSSKPKKLKSPADLVNDFTRMKMREDWFYKKIIPPIPIANDELDKCVYTDEPVKITTPKYENPLYVAGWDKLPDIKDVMVAQPLQSAGLHINDPDWDGASYAAYEDPWIEEDDVDIAFWYYKDTDLLYSIRRMPDGFFYDFATKRFALVPLAPRAGMPRAEPIKPSGCVYSTRLSGKLDDGEYVVTFRDTKASDVVVGIMSVFMKDGVQQQSPPKGLDNTPIEQGIPMPEHTFHRSQRVRTVDVG